MIKNSCQKVFFILCLLLAAAGVLARFSLLNVSLEYDELFTAVTANPALPLGWIWSNCLAPDVHPPLYNLLLYAYSYIVPYGPEIWLRLPSVLCGLGALVCGWFLFPNWLGKTARLIFVSMMTCNALLIFFSQYARAYALLLWLAVLLTFLFLRISRAVARGKLIRKKQWVYYAVLSLLLCWSHYFGALLFGSLSVVLLAQAVWKKRNITAFVLVPGVVFILFLPWLLPNLLSNFSQQRFGGNWWANQMPPQLIVPRLMLFFFSSLWGHFIMALLAIGGVWQGYGVYKRRGQFPYVREMGALLLVLAVAFSLVGLLAFKINLFLGRYFIAFMPAVYLVCAVLVAPVVRRRKTAMCLFVVFLGLGMWEYGTYYKILGGTSYLAARPTAEVYRDRFSDKELFVVAVEAFPPASMAAMYGFYPNQIFKMNQPVTELFQLGGAARDQVLERRNQAIIWMPNCDEKKLKRVSDDWNRAVLVYFRLGNSCFLQVSDKGDLKPRGWELPTPHPRDEPPLGKGAPNYVR